MLNSKNTSLTVYKKTLDSKDDVNSIYFIGHEKTHCYALFSDFWKVEKFLKLFLNKIEYSPNSFLLFWSL